MQCKSRSFSSETGETGMNLVNRSDKHLYSSAQKNFLWGVKLESPKAMSVCRQESMCVKLANQGCSRCAAQVVVQRVHEDFCVKIVSVGFNAVGILKDEEEVCCVWAGGFLNLCMQPPSECCQGCIPALLNSMYRHTPCEWAPSECCLVCTQFQYLIHDKT